MPYLTQLAAVARRTGFAVVEVPGWKTRGHGPQPEVDGVVCHHTAGWNDMHIVRDGRPGLDGPLSQIWLRRDGTIFVVAAGRCWHNAPSLSLGHTNSHSIGIEAENDGRAPWPAKQLDAYKRLCAELCREFKLSASMVKGHKEVNRSKPDPHSINMGDFRADVARLMKGEKPKSLPEQDGVPEFQHPLKLVSPMMRGDHVRAWQARAKQIGFALDADGIYGGQSETVCRALQRRAGIPITGAVDEETWLLTFIWDPEPKE